VKLAAEPLRRLEEHHLVAAERGDLRRLQARRRRRPRPSRRAAAAGPARAWPTPLRAP
jgi:hypothetical protein